MRSFKALVAAVLLGWWAPAQAAITFVAKSAAGNTLPAGITTNDVLICGSTTAGTPGGYTALGATSFFWRRVTGGDPNPGTGGMCVAFRGVIASGSPVEADTSDVLSTWTLPSITTASNGAMVVGYIWGSGTDDGSTCTANASITSGGAFLTGAGPNVANNGTLCSVEKGYAIYYAIKTAAGAVGSQTFVGDFSGVGGSSMDGQMIALTPAGGSVPLPGVQIIIN